MKTYLATLKMLFLPIFLLAQTGEFQIYPNGLIYKEATMNQLSQIVDSLNLKYTQCELNRVYYSLKQTIGQVVKLKKGDIKAANQDIENQIALPAFIKKYPDAIIEDSVLITKTKYKNHKGDVVIKFNQVSVGKGSSYYFKRNELEHPDLYENQMENTWIFTHRTAKKPEEESIVGFYFPTTFQSIPLKEKYANMIGYADCLIDTTTLKFKEDVTIGEGNLNLPDNWLGLSPLQKVKLLDIMRSTKVVGRCSQDNSPREHAVNIAMLSAETSNWKVFLRAHLDVMNDRFARSSDWSSASKPRKTYIKELELLDINVVDLLFGIALRMENPAQNHYYGSTGRLGRALAETQNKPIIEQGILSMIEDSELDDYNRIMAYFLFANYNYHLEDEAVKKENVQKLKKAITKLPVYLKSKIKIKEK